MSLLERLKDCTISRDGVLSQVNKLKIAKAVSDEIDERKVILRSEVVDVLATLAGVPRNEKLPFADKYLSRASNPRLWDRFQVKSISVRAAALKHIQKEHPSRNENQILISSDDARIANTCANSFLYKSESELAIHIQKILEELPATYNYIILDQSQIRYG